MQTVQKVKRENPKAMSDVWKNLVLVQAGDVSEAYQKLTKIGKSEEGDIKGSLLLWGKPAITKFVGVGNLGVVHDELVDGAEILWSRVKCSQVKAKSFIKPKSQLLAEAERELSFHRIEVS